MADVNPDNFFFYVMRPCMEKYNTPGPSFINALLKLKTKYLVGLIFLRITSYVIYKHEINSTSKVLIVSFFVIFKVLFKCLVSIMGLLH